MLQSVDIQKDLLDIIYANYNISGQLKKLAGEVDFNFLLKTADEKFLVKLSREAINEGNLDFELKLIQELRKNDFPFLLPLHIRSIDNRSYIPYNNQSIRVQNWIEGRVLGNVNPRTDALLIDWGHCCGHLSRALVGFDHPAAHRTYKWDPSLVMDWRDAIGAFPSGEQNKLLAFYSDFEKHITSIHALRKSVNYNDAHEHNILVSHKLHEPSIVGIIDFGDALYTQTINELAIACAYAGMGFLDPLEALKKVVKAYHSVFPILEKELEVLALLIQARLVLTIIHANINKIKEPENVYLQISLNDAWETFNRLREIPLKLFEYTFRNACGYSTHPHSMHFKDWAKNKEFHNVVSSAETAVALDLSVGSSALGNYQQYEDIKTFSAQIQHLLSANNGDIGVGGYGEVRPFYSSDAYRVMGNQGAQWRTVHLGVDYWSSAETVVYAPWDGIVKSVKNNLGRLNYGPTIILEHKTREFTFYTLFGHLDDSCLSQLQAGDIIKKGQAIAKIGTPPNNGHWPPHLHFQIILDLLEEDGDFPGVAFPHAADIWLDICPNPKILFPALPDTYAIASLEDLIHTRKNILGPNLSISYQKPIQMLRGKQQYLFSADGRRFLDTVNNVAHVGHEHPRIVKAGAQQMGVLNTNSRYLHPLIIEYARALRSTLPSALEVIYFVNSGSEANELALRMIDTCSGRQDIVALEIGYHGNTNKTIDVSSYKFDGKGGSGAPNNTHIISRPDPFRGKYKGAKAAVHYLEDLDNILDQLNSKGDAPAGFIAESILSCGGQVVPPNGFIKAAYEKIRTVGGYCIADEVQTGFGRVGSHFWAFELHEVVPDIVTMGKPIGNGHPLGAVACTRSVAEAFANGMEYFNTFGGNPVSCAIGLEVLRVIEDEKLQQNALKVGSYLKSQLKNLQSEFPIIADVRGEGLFLGFELIKPKSDLIPATTEAKYLKNRMRDRAILMSTDGPDENVLKIKPPMCFTIENADFLIENLTVILKEDPMNN